MPTTPVNGTTLYHEVVGDGPTCLVLNGWPGVDHTYLRPSLDRLGDTLRLLYYDHRGNGRSGRPPLDTITMEQLADDADGLAESLGEDRVLVLGHFHGASVAQELALRHPERVAGLILVAATPGELGMLENLADSLDVAPPPVEVDILQRVPPELDDELAATMLGLAPYFFHGADQPDAGALFVNATFNAEAASRWMQHLAFLSAFDRLEGLDVPALLLVGRHDVFSPPAQSARIARRLTNAETVVFEDSGHVPWLEEPDAFIASVRAWVDRLEGIP